MMIWYTPASTTLNDPGASFASSVFFYDAARRFRAPVYMLKRRKGTELRTENQKALYQDFSVRSNFFGTIVFANTKCLVRW